MISEEFVLCEADVVPLRIEFICLLGCEVLTPTPGVVPVVVLKNVFVFLCYDSAVLQLILVAHELSEVAALISAF